MVTGRFLRRRAPIAGAARLHGDRAVHVAKARDARGWILGVVRAGDHFAIILRRDVGQVFLCLRSKDRGHQKQQTGQCEEESEEALAGQIGFHNSFPLNCGPKQDPDQRTVSSMTLGGLLMGKTREWKKVAEGERWNLTVMQY